MVANSIETGVPGSPDVVETRGGLPRPLTTLLIALVAAVVHVAVNGYSYGGCTERLPAASPSGDHANILPWVYWYQDNSLFPHDPQVQSGASYATVLWRIVAWCGRAAPLPYVFFLFHIIALIGTYAALFCLARLLGENNWAGVMACVLFFVARDAPAGEATHDPAFYTRMAALPLALASVYGALRSRPIITFSALTAAVAVHLLTAIYAAPIVLGIWMFATGQSRHVRLLWAVGFILASIGIMFLIGGGSGITLSRPTNEWLDLQRGNNVMHLFPSMWPMPVWRDLLFATILIALPVIAWTTPLLRRFAIVVLIVCTCMAVAGWAFAEKWPSMLIMQLQPLRALKIGMILAFVSGAAWLCRIRSSIALLVAAGCLAAWLAKLDAAFVILVAASILVRLLPSLRDREINRLFGAITIGATALVVAGILVRSTVDSVALPDGRTMRRYRPTLELPWRAIDSPWVDVQLWIAAHTPTDAYFITPPILEGFRTHARRSEYADWKQGTLSLFHERFGLGWLSRLGRLVGPSGGRLTYVDLYNRYNSFTADEFQSLAGEYGLTHAVTMKPVAGLAPIYSNRIFWVYALR